MENAFTYLKETLNWLGNNVLTTYNGKISF